MGVHHRRFPENGDDRLHPQSQKTSRKKSLGRAMGSVRGRAGATRSRRIASAVPAWIFLLLLPANPAVPASFGSDLAFCRRDGEQSLPIRGNSNSCSTVVRFSNADPGSDAAVIVFRMVKPQDDVTARWMSPKSYRSLRLFLLNRALALYRGRRSTTRGCIGRQAVVHYLRLMERSGFREAAFPLRRD